MPVKIKQQGEESQCAEEAQEANGEKEEEVEGPSGGGAVDRRVEVWL